MPRALALATLAVASLTPALALAQPAAELSSPSVSEPPTSGWEPLRDVNADHDEGPGLAGLYGYAWLGLLAGGGAGAGLGAAIGASIFYEESSGDVFLIGPVTGGLLVGAIGAPSVAPFGAALAVWMAGNGQGGTGNFFASLGMAYLGAAIGFGSGILLGFATNDGLLSAPIGAALGVGLATFGAALGYDVSRSGERRTSESESATFIAPYITPTERSDGAVVGVFGAL
ncbi:MAG: hypothetical protein AB7S26_08085 [Sandaracinaceae bacterium]